MISLIIYMLSQIFYVLQSLDPTRFFLAFKRYDCESEMITMSSPSSQEIREELGHDLVNLRLEDIDEVNKELKAAKKDDLVWKAGLDLQYL